ncbi:MAG: hypothetical protein LPK02_09005 [Rhodobacterales bacterium]|nr:hypothetical protein [Rhodobacterales bacterium]MDX5413170.1 hypothetical protein [Rhodobacterales bacterium]
MSDAFYDFDNRLRRIQKSRVKLAKGYVSVVGDDGLIVVKPQRRRAGFHLRALAFVIIGFMGFKILILAALGQGVYEERVDTLREGSTVERAGAWVMQPDPLSVMAAQKIRAYLP